MDLPVIADKALSKALGRAQTLFNPRLPMSNREMGSAHHKNGAVARSLTCQAKLA